MIFKDVSTASLLVPEPEVRSSDAGLAVTGVVVAVVIVLLVEDLVFFLLSGVCSSE